MESWDIIITLLIIAGFLFFLSAIIALYWAAKNGQFESIEKGARVVFDEDEPEGVEMDAFPQSKPKKQKNHS